MNAVTPLPQTEIARTGASRDTIQRFENALRPMEQTDCPLKHTFAPGMYAREILLPADTFIVGKIHKHAHLNIVTKGRCIVVTEFGTFEVDATRGPITFTSDAGTKRALYVQEETIWTTIHLTNSTDLAEIEREIIAPTYDELDTFLAGARVMLERVSLRPGSQLPSPEEPH